MASRVYIDKTPPKVSKPITREVSYPENEPTLNVVKGNIVFEREIYSNEEFRRRVNRDFNEIIATPDEENIQGFFNEYNKLFFSIPKVGDNSHTSLVEASSNYINGYRDPKDKIIESLENSISKLELEIYDLKNPQENPLFPNGTIITYNTTPYYMDKGYRRPIDYTIEFWEVLNRIALNKIEVNETILKGIPIGPRLNSSNFSDPFIPNDTTETIGEIISQLDPSDAPLNPNRYNNLDEYKLALQKDLNEKDAVIANLSDQITAINNQINALLALENVDKSNNTTTIIR